MKKFGKGKGLCFPQDCTQACDYYATPPKHVKHNANREDLI